MIKNICPCPESRQPLSSQPRVRTFTEAYQASGILVLIIIALMVAPSLGLLFLSPVVAVLVGCAFDALDACLIRVGIRTSSRSELIARI